MPQATMIFAVCVIFPLGSELGEGILLHFFFQFTVGF